MRACMLYSYVVLMHVTMLHVQWHAYWKYNKMSYNNTQYNLYLPRAMCISTP